MIKAKMTMASNSDINRSMQASSAQITSIAQEQDKIVDNVKLLTTKINKELQESRDISETSATYMKEDYVMLDMMIETLDKIVESINRVSQDEQHISTQMHDLAQQTAQIRSILEMIKDLKQKNRFFSHIEFKKLLDDILDMKNSANSSDEWLSTIPTTINNFKKYCLCN